jgi:hypothetical protein
MNFWTISLLFVAVAPAIFVWLRERRLRKLALAELNLAKSVTALEALMLSGEIRQGGVCHDVLFSAMQMIQYHRKYSLPWNVLRSPSAKRKSFRSQLESELNADGCMFKEHVFAFHKAYYEAFRQKHPWQQKFHFGYVLFLYLTARGLLTFLTQVLNIFVKWATFAEYLHRQFFVQAGAYELEASSQRSDHSSNGMTLA